MRFAANDLSGSRPRLMSASRLLCAAAMSAAPPQFATMSTARKPYFGGRDGPCIINKDTVLNEVDAALTVNRPPGELPAHP